MYLSRAELDPTRRETMVALISPQKFHSLRRRAPAKSHTCCTLTRKPPLK